MKGWYATLRRVTNGSVLRTDTVGGFCTQLPEEGKAFVMFSESLTIPDGYRRIQTSRVVSVALLSQSDRASKYLFKTQNSTYTVTLTEVTDVAEAP